MSLNRSRAIGVVGSLIVAVGVFVPALSFRQAVHASLWDAHPWTACLILASVALAFFLCGAGRLGWLVITAIGMAAVTSVQLFIELYRIHSALAENAEFSKREPGWAGLYALGIPEVHWLGWVLLLSGAAVVVIAGISSMQSPASSMTETKPAN